MNTLGKGVALLVGLALLGAMGFGVYLMFQTIVALFAALDPAVATVTGIACLVALVAAWWIARSLRTALRQGRANSLRAEKTATYQLFVDYWRGLLLGRPEAPENLNVLERVLALYGAPAVIGAHNGLRELHRQACGQQAGLRARFAEALIAIRTDLGADAPRELARDLERLLLPAREARGDTEQSADRPLHPASVPGS